MLLLKISLQAETLFIYIKKYLFFVSIRKISSSLDDVISEANFAVQI